MGTHEQGLAAAAWEGSLAGSPLPGPCGCVAQPMHSWENSPPLGMPSNSCHLFMGTLGMGTPLPPESTAPAPQRRISPQWGWDPAWCLHTHSGCPQNSSAGPCRLVPPG